MEWASSSRCGVHLTSWRDDFRLGEGLAPVELEAVGADGHPLGGLAIDAPLGRRKV